jgi:hypothetical protein
MKNRMFRWLVVALLGGISMGAAGLQKGGGDSPAAKQEKALAANIAKAPLAVEGTVEKVREIPKEKLIAAKGGRKPITEHDPQLREAVVQVKSALKGEVKGDTKKIVVVFASSKDPYNRDRPKFKEGEKGIFILHKDELKDETAKKVLLTKTDAHEGEIYTALEANDFFKEDAKQDPEGQRLKQVRALIEKHK